MSVFEFNTFQISQTPLHEVCAVAHMGVWLYTHPSRTLSCINESLSLHLPLFTLLSQEIDFSLKYHPIFHLDLQVVSVSSFDLMIQYTT